MVNKFSKYTYFIASADSCSATTVATVFMDHVYKLHGLPGSIVSDRNSVFLRPNFPVFLRPNFMAYP
jgi:hypothetical protein